MSLQTGLLVEDRAAPASQHPPKLRMRGHLNAPSSTISGGQNVQYTVFRTRWWVLAVYALVGAAQCCNCYTLPSLPQSSEEYFKISRLTVSYVFNWGPIMNAVGALPASTLAASCGLPTSIRLSAGLATAGALLRCLPTFLPLVLQTPWMCVACLHVSSAVNGMGGALLLVLPSLLSVTWFPVRERLFATGVGSTMPAAGAALGFYVGPRVVKHAGDLPQLLYLEAAASAATLLLALCYLPRAPPLPASAAGEHRLSAPAAAMAASKRPMCSEQCAALSNVPFVVTVVTIALAMGVFSSWVALVPAALVAPAMGFSEEDANTFLLANTFAGVLGGFTVGPLSALLGLRRRLKLLLWLLVVLQLGVGVVLSLSMTSPWWKEPVLHLTWLKTVLHSEETSRRILMLALFALSGFFGQCIGPPLFETAAEMTFPLAESTSGGVLSLGMNLFGVLFVLIAPWLELDWMTPVAVGALVLAAVVFAFVPVEMRRPE